MDKWRKAGKAILIILILFFLFWQVINILRYITISQLYQHYVDSVSDLTGLNKYLVKVGVLLLLLPFFWGLKWYFFSFGDTRKKYTGAVMVLVVIVIYNLGLYNLTRGSYFEFSKGKVIKWYAKTPEGIRFFDAPGFDPKYGLKLIPVTPEIVSRMEKQKRGLEPKRLKFVSLDEIEFFDRLTGENKIWYYLKDSGRYELFDSAGIHPTYGEALKPVTRAVILLIQAKLDEDKQAKQVVAKELANKEATEKREAFLNQYIQDRSFFNQPNSKEIAVMLIDETGEPTQDLDQMIAASLIKEGVKATISLFTKRFIVDGIFEKIFNGSSDEIKKLELLKHCDYIFLGKYSVKYIENPDLQNMITAKVTIVLNIIDVKRRTIKNRFTLTKAGVGFSQDSAKSLAKERILEAFESQILNSIT